MSRPTIPRPELTLLEGCWLAGTAFAVAFVPALGVLLAALGAMHGAFEDRRGLLAVYVVLAAAGAALELSRL